MTITERIRQLLAQGATTDEIVAATGSSANYIRKVRWQVKHPEYKAQWMRRWRECNPEVEKARRQRSSMQRLIRAEQAHQARKAERVQKIMGPAHWYG